MPPRITSIEIEKLGDEDQLEFEIESNSDDDPIIIYNSTGDIEIQRIITNALGVCFSGDLWFNQTTSLNTQDRVASSNLKTQATSSVSVTILTVDDQEYRLRREYHTVPTEYGTQRYVDPLHLSLPEESRAEDYSPRILSNQVYPDQAAMFSIIGSEPLISRNAETGWEDLVEMVDSAGRKQAAAMDMTLPSYLSSKQKLGQEILDQVNQHLSTIPRYENSRVTAKDGELVLQQEVGDELMKAAPSAGHWTLVSHLTTLAAGEALPSVPPLVGNSPFGRANDLIQTQLLQAITSSDRQSILLLTELEMERIETDTDFELSSTSDSYQIEATQSEI